MELFDHSGYQWNLMQLMNGPLIIQSVLEWMKANFITAQTPFIDISALVQWTIEDITLLFALMLQALPVTQSEALHENVLMGHIKQAYFSAIAAIQRMRLGTNCPYKMTGYQKKQYVIPPLVQLMILFTKSERSLLRLWHDEPISLATQLLMQITPSSIDIIRGLKYKITLQNARNLVSIKRLIKSCENKYVILFNPELVNVWVEAADTTQKQAQIMQIKTNDPNLWAAALWYLDNNAEVHKLLRGMTPDRKGSKRSGEQVEPSIESGAGFLSLPDRKKE